MNFMNDRNTMQVTRSLALSTELTGAMICIKGNAFGSRVILQSDKRLVVGRDSQSCNYTIQDSKISRVHFEITYIGALNQYRVIDYSTNGTFLQDGTRLNKNQEYYLPPTTELSLGKGSNIYKLS